MKTVTQTILYRQALIKYSEKYGATKFVPAACIVGDAKGQGFYQYTALQ